MNHPKLRGHPTDYAKYGALALQRAGHSSPIETDIEQEGKFVTSDIEWDQQDMTPVHMIDSKRLTEDGAEAVAIAYVHYYAGWVIKRRLQPGESADWLLTRATDSLAMEVSGTTAEKPESRILEKVRQVSRCTLPAERLAVVVSFAKPLILARRP